MSDWTHSLCRECYRHEEPGRTPYRIKDDSTHTCCRCGEPTSAGIYYRNQPDAYKHCTHE